MIERAKCDKVLLMEKKRQEDFQTGRYKFLVEFAVQPGTQQSAIHWTSEDSIESKAEHNLKGNLAIYYACFPPSTLWHHEHECSGRISACSSIISCYRKCISGSISILAPILEVQELDLRHLLSLVQFHVKDFCSTSFFAANITKRGAYAGCHLWTPMYHQKGAYAPGCHLWTPMWSHECSPVRTTMADGKSEDVTVRVLF